MIATIHQPEHMVWLGFLDKISKADLYVIFDDTQFKKHYFENRNKIRTKEGSMWLIVPVKDQPLATQIKDIEITQDGKWRKKYLNAIKTNYSRTPYFKKYFPKIEEIINKEHKYLIDLNLDLLNFFFFSFGIKKRKIRSSEMHITKSKNGSELCLQICQNVGADTYLAGSTAGGYIKEGDFEKAGIKIIFHKFKHPKYSQAFPGFENNMSAIDALFNLGPEAKKLII